MFEPLAIGNCTLKAEVSDESSTRKSSGTIGVKLARGTRAQKVSAPSAMTKRMYQRARGARSRSKSTQVYFFPNENRGREARTAADVRPPRAGRGAHAARGGGGGARADRRRHRVGGRAAVRARGATHDGGASGARGGGAGVHRRSAIADR